MSSAVLGAGTADDYVLDLSFGHANEKPLADYFRLGVLTITGRNAYSGGMLTDSSRGYVAVPHEWSLIAPD